MRTVKALKQVSHWARCPHCQTENDLTFGQSADLLYKEISVLVDCKKCKKVFEVEGVED